MANLRMIWVGLLIVSAGVCAAAQDNSQPATVPAPAFGQSAPVLNPENPPLSGLDEPSLDLKRASRSFVSPAIQIGETADTNENNLLGVTNVRPVSHVLGAFDLQRFWPKSDLFAEYLGGGAFQTEPKYVVKQLQAFGLEGITRWRTGFVELRDAFSYIPDGSFDLGTAEGLPGLGIAFGVGTGEGVPGIMRFGGGNEAVGNIPRLSNTAVADIVQAISPRSALTLVGAFGNAHFYDNTGSLINSDQTTVEAGYSHMISRRDQLAGVYAFQLFRFPYSTGGQVDNHVFNLRWSRTITGRMRLIIGAGPQYTNLQYGTSSQSWTLSGRAVLRYQFEHAALAATWAKYASAGSGFYAGANTQIARLSFRRPLGRSYLLVTEAGYTHNQRLQSPSGGDYSFSSDNEGTAAFILRRHVGRTYDIFAAYTFNEVAFDVAAGASNCANTTGCGTIAQRHRGTIGVEWHPKPTRIE
jgi:hypothetical protein